MALTRGSYKVIAAPSKFALAVAFFDLYKGKRRTVTLGLKVDSQPEGDEFTVEVIINRLEWDGGSGERWRFKGWIVGRASISGSFDTDQRFGQVIVE